MASDDFAEECHVQHARRRPQWWLAQPCISLCSIQEYTKARTPRHALPGRALRARAQAETAVPLELDPESLDTAVLAENEVDLKSILLLGILYFLPISGNREQPYRVQEPGHPHSRCSAPRHRAESVAGQLNSRLDKPLSLCRDVLVASRYAFTHRDSGLLALQSHSSAPRHWAESGAGCPA